MERPAPAARAGTVVLDQPGGLSVRCDCLCKGGRGFYPLQARRRGPRTPTSMEGPLRRAFRCLRGFRSRPRGARVADRTGERFERAPRASSSASATARARRPAISDAERARTCLSDRTALRFVSGDGRGRDRGRRDRRARSMRWRCGPTFGRADRPFCPESGKSDRRRSSDRSAAFTESPRSPETSGHGRLASPARTFDR
jgi:hypothetical protein